MAVSLSTATTSTGAQSSSLDNGSPIPVKKRRQNRDKINSLPTTPQRGGQNSAANRESRRRIVSTGSANDLSTSPGITANYGDPSTPTPSRAQRRSSEPPQQLLTPPPQPRHANSAPVIPTVRRTPRKSPKSNPEKLTPPMVDNNVAQILRQRLKEKKPSKTSKGKEAEGFNYIMDTALEQEGSVNLVKVGFTKGSVQERERQIQDKCKRKTRWKPRYTPLPIRHYKEIEALVKAELSMTRYEFFCDSCKSTHTEYHTISRNHAIDVTERWIYFCETEPWDETGCLHPFWEERLRNLQVRSRDQSPIKGSCDPISWEEFTKVGIFSISWFNFCCLWKRFMHRGIQWLIFLLTLVMSSWGLWGFRIFVLSTVAIMAKFTCENITWMDRPKRNHPKTYRADINLSAEVPGAFEEELSYTEHDCDGDDRIGEEDILENGDIDGEDVSTADEMEVDDTILEESVFEAGTEDLPIIIPSSDDEMDEEYSV